MSSFATKEVVETLGVLVLSPHYSLSGPRFGRIPHLPEQKFKEVLQIVLFE